MNVELFNSEFENCVAHLKSYVLRITASVADAEDILLSIFNTGFK